MSGFTTSKPELVGIKIRKQETSFGSIRRIDM